MEKCLMEKVKKSYVFLLASFIVFGLTGTAMATNGYQLIGIGAKQKSMGGAVTAAPMDAMTAISNPAGMARIGKRADFSVEAFMPKRSVNFSATGGGSTEGGAELYGIPSLGWVAPAFGKDDVFFGGGMYVTSGLGVDYDQTVFMPGTALDQMSGASSGTFNDVTFSGFSAIQFWKMAPTVAWNVDDSLSIGLALNIDYQSVTIKQKFQNIPFYNDPTNPMLGITQMDVNLDLGRPTNQMGFGATLGVMYDVAKWATLGAAYSSKQMFNDSEFRVGTDDVKNFNGATGQAGTYKMDLDYPQQAAIGVSLKPTKTLMIAMDVKWLNWSSTHDKVDFKGPNGAFMTKDGPTNSTTLDFGWEDQWIYALGIQYIPPIKGLALRVGYNYSKAPIDEADVFNNLILPALVEHHITCGIDYMLGEHWGVSLAYMKALKNDATGKGDVPQGFQDATPFTADSGAKISLEEDSVGIQLSYLF